MKKKITKILSIIMICCISLLCVGCMGDSPYDTPDFDNLAFDMYGTKVLYRPLNYDYDIGSGATGGQTNDYYGKYAWNIINDLYQIYGITNDKKVADRLNNHFLSDNLPYLYDSIRYKVDTYGNVTSRKTIEVDGSETTDDTVNYIIIGADLNSSWKWSFDYDLSALNQNYNALLCTNDEYSLNQNNHIYAKYSNDNEFTIIFNNKYLTTQSFIDKYTSIYLGTDKQNETTLYSDYVKALEYVIYSYALDLEPKTVTVTINDNVTSENGPFYNVKIGNYQSVDDALNDIKTLFKKIGSYVGLIDRQINKISAWIKTNVIGIGFNITSDNFYTYSDVIEVIQKNADGTSQTYYEFGANVNAPNLGRDYNNAVNNIVKNVCENVSIGRDEESGQDVTIDNRFLASEVREYAGNTFLVKGDENFPVYEEGQTLRAIRPLEYQSVLVMPKERKYITDVWVALKYDADLDGTEEDEYNLEKYIDVIVELNYYNYSQKKLYTIGSQKTRVYDGPWEFAVHDQIVPDDHGTVMFSDFDESCTDPAFKACLNGDAISLGSYNLNFANGKLNTDVANGNYCGDPVVSENPLILVGTTDVRKYYQIIEPQDNELEGNQTYITGRLNENMFGGDDGCDYLEITYKVLKTRGDSTTNYKFYTGIAGIIDT